MFTITLQFMGNLVLIKNIIYSKVNKIINVKYKEQNNKVHPCV